MSGLLECVNDLRAMAAETPDDRAIIARVPPLAGCLALSKQWLELRHNACDPLQGFGVHLLYEEPDHTFDVFALAWLPGRGAPPHNHATWGVGAGGIFS